MKKFSIVTNVRTFFCLLILLVVTVFATACAPTERPTGYKANPDHEGYVVQTCDEEEILQNWWSFETDNAIVNTLAPSYDDYCTYVEKDYVFMWNTVEQYGFYNYNWLWSCKNQNNMSVVDLDSETRYNIRIYGKMNSGDYAGCYDVKVTEAGITVNGYVCPCEYNGP